MKLLVILLISVLLLSCSVNEIIVDAVSGALGGDAANIILGDDDPDFVGDALPFMLKLYEALLELDQENPALYFTLGSGYVSYANIFVQLPAEMLPDDQFTEQMYQLLRAKKLYLRGRDYVLNGLELKYPGFINTLVSGDYENAVSMLQVEDVSNVYWAVGGWLSALAVDLFDYELTLTSSQVIALLVRALELDESYGDGSIHEVFISLYAAIPENMMYRTPDPEKDDMIKVSLDSYYEGKIDNPKDFDQRLHYHYERALELGGDKKISSYISWATTYAVQNQDAELYTSLLETAIGFDVDVSIENRLANVAMQRKAQWLLDNIELFILF